MSFMSEFDPYHKWLGISPQHQPPNHYRLLSLDLYESDADVIEASVDRIVAFLQDVAVGPHSNASQRLLNEIAAVRLCLLDKAQKAAYDEKLGAELAQAIWPPGDESEPAPPPVAPAFAIDTGTRSVAKTPSVRKPNTNRPAVTTAPNRGDSSPPGKADKRAQQKPSPVLLISFVSGGGLLIFAVAFALLAGGNSEAKRQADEEARVRERLDSFAEMGREAESMIPDFQPQLNYDPPPPAKKSNKKRRKRNRTQSVVPPSGTSSNRAN
jgi:hypothetical protein